MAEVVAGVRAIAGRRRVKRIEAIQVARGYAEALDEEIPLATAVVFGSYARGDFNTWSDIDVLVLADALPADFRERLDVLWHHRPGGVEPVGWTLSEHRTRRQRRDPIAVEADTVGILVLGTLPFPVLAPGDREFCWSPGARTQGGSSGSGQTAGEADLRRS